MERDVNTPYTSLSTRLRGKISKYLGVNPQCYAFTLKTQSAYHKPTLFKLNLIQLQYVQEGFLGYFNLTKLTHFPLTRFLLFE